MSEEKLKTYASNFLESEIESIDKLLKQNISEEDRHLLKRVKIGYEHDLAELETDVIAGVMN